MSPLSALRTLEYPALHANAPVRTVADPAAAKVIPFSELEKLSPGILPQSVGAANAAPAGFDQVITGLVNQVGARQAAASAAVNGLLDGQNVSLHQTMIAMEEASISFQLMVEVRNKLLESYQELMRMQI